MAKEKKDKRTATEVLADEGIDVGVILAKDTWTLICKTYIETANGSQELVNLMQNDQTKEIKVM